MKLRLCIPVIFALVVFVAGCGKNIPLEDTLWVLQFYGPQDNLKAVLPDTQVTVTFRQKEGQVTGTGGCNIYGGSYELAGNKLSIPEPLISTEMSCGYIKDQQEAQYFMTLQSSDSYHIVDGKLTISCDDNVLIFKQK